MEGRINDSLPCSVMELNQSTYIFKDVIGDGNCAFHAVCYSNMIPPMQHNELRAEVCQFALGEGRYIGERIYAHTASVTNIINLNLDSYIERMSNIGTYAGMFEFTMISFMFKINITIIQRDARLTTTSTLRTLQSFHRDLVENVSWRRPTSRNLHLLLHQYSMPHLTCTNPNHFGILFPLNAEEVEDCNRNSPSLVLRSLLRRNSNSTQRHLKRQTTSIKDIEQERNTEAKRVKKLDDAVGKEIRFCDAMNRKMKRHDPVIQKAEQLKNTKSKRVKRRDCWHGQPLAICESKFTNDILNHSTEADLSDEYQDHLLEKGHAEEIYFALNSFGDLMGEEQLATILCAVCACKYIRKYMTRLPMCKVPNNHLLQAGPQHKTLDSSGKWVLLKEATFNQDQRCNESEELVAGMLYIHICKQCLRQLEQGKIPLRSLASFDTGVLPTVLQSVRLTFVERMLLSCNFTVFHIFKVENASKLYMPSSTRARVSKGHCISFKHAKTLDAIERFILPHDATTLPKLMITAYIGPSNSVEEARELVSNTKQLTVRTDVIHLFAKEYAKVNPSRMMHDPSRFSEHVSGTVPEVVMNMIDFESMVEDTGLGKPTFLDMDDAIHDDYAKRDQMRPGDAADPNIDVIQNSGMVLPHLLSNGMQELKEASLHKLRTNVLAIPTSRIPVSDYDPRYFLDNYPNIFFYETGERPVNVPLPIYLSTLMRRQCTGAALDYSFPFEARNVIVRHRTLHRVRFSLSLEHSSIIPKITDGDLENALTAIQNKDPINDRVKSLLKQLQISGADLRGTPQKLNRYRQQIIAGLFPMFGPFDVWITLNIQESSSQVLLRIAGEQQVPISYEVPKDVPNISRRMQICAENPMAVAEFFHVFMQAFLDALLGLPYGKNDHSPTHRGIFGWTRAYMFILEVSGKATGPHAHGLLKIQGLNRQKLISRMHDQKFNDIYKQYLASTYTQTLPNEHFDVEVPMRSGKENDLIRTRRENEELLRSVQPVFIPRSDHFMGMYPLMQLPSSKEEIETSKGNIQEYLAKRLIRIVRECMVHEHSPTCAKNGHTGDDADCRMSYPQPLFDNIVVYLDEHIDEDSQQLIINGVEVLFPRDHMFVVAMNKWITLALGSNTAVYYMASGKQGRTKAIYATEYSTKKPLSTYECITLFRASLQAKKKHQATQSLNDCIFESNDSLSSCSIVNRCLNALSAEVVITGYECCADICGYPDHYASSSFVPFSGWSHMYSMLGLSSRQTFNVVSLEQSKTKERRATLVSPVQDYMYLDIPDKEKMTPFQFAAFYQRVSKKKDKRGKNYLQKKNKQRLQDAACEIDEEENASSSTEDEDHPKYEDNEEKLPIGRPMHTRIDFKKEHKLCETHHVYRLAKMQVPYQVGRRYPTLPSRIKDASKEQLEVYAQYMLAIFRAWSPTFNTTIIENETWWSTFKTYMATCEPWVTTVISNMRLAVERDDTITRKSKHMERISSNTMNHAEKNFECMDDGELDWKKFPEMAASLLCQLQSDMMLTGLNLSRPTHEKEQVYVTNGLQGLLCRFDKINHLQTQSNNWAHNASLLCILEQQFSRKEIEKQLHSWQSALKELIRCNDAGTSYDMDTLSGTKVSSSYENDLRFRNCIEGLIKDPLLVALPDPGSESMFVKTTSRPSWARLKVPPSILQTLQEWHLTRKQAEFVILVLNHFHNVIDGLQPNQLLALCVGAPGTGKSQTMLAILWHMSQHRQSSLRDEVATCAFTGGAAMLISTPHTTPMTTCRQFQINLKGPSKTAHSVHVLTNRTADLLYVLIDEFSFLSYRHLKDISEQVTIGLGERAEKHKPFGGMNFIFFGDYEQLSKPGDYAMYYGAAAEENMENNEMKAWFTTEMEHHLNHSSYDVTSTFIGRDIWTSINTIRTLNVQKRQDNSPDGLQLVNRCQALRDEDFPDEFFESIQQKAITEKQLTSEAWSNPLYIVMRHSLRVPIDFQEARFQAHRLSKRFIEWETIDTIHGKPLPEPLQLIVNKIVIDKIPRIQYFYEGMPVAFIDNRYFAAGNATNNMGHAISIALDPREPIDDFSKNSRKLLYMPMYVLIHVQNAQMHQLYPDLPPKVIPVIPSAQYHRLRLGDNRYKLQNGKNVSHISVKRLGMRWIGVHAVTQYFSQGMNLAGRKCIIDLRIPTGGGPLNDYAQSILVMLSRHKNDSDWALLHPLWTHGNELQKLEIIHKMKKLLCRDPDLHAELRRIQKIENDITEVQLQHILQRHPLLKIFIENA